MFENKDIPHYLYYYECLEPNQLNFYQTFVQNCL